MASTEPAYLLHLPASLKAEAARQAAAEGRSLASLIREAITVYVELERDRGGH